ncbi:chemotaxis protein CheC [Desulfosporosinus sp. OT]|uniref:chemotaxis protein CheC n=1 Tax=Desulfosporosinus sp. OT TaxID=913865 RepID=UPI00030668D7|nr:chemotaxis protein CheC [Desulfosporosinus sp. OT]
MTVSELDFSEYKYLSVFSSGHVVSSSMSFGNGFQGKAFLVFPPEQAKLLVTACVGEPVLPVENENIICLVDTDLDILREIGNLIINAIIGEFGNLLNIRVEYSLPEIELISLSETQKILLENDIYILVLHTSFTLSKTRITGAVLIALSLNSVSLLLEKVNELSEDLNG